VNNQNTQEALVPSGCQFLTFSIMGTQLGVDIEQIDQMLETDQIKAQTDRAFWLHEIIPFRGEPIAYRAPKVLLIKDTTQRTGIIIDQPESVIQVDTEAIHSLPFLAESAHRTAQIWGVTVNEKGIVLLIDLHELMRNSRETDADTHKQ